MSENCAGGRLGDIRSRRDGGLRAMAVRLVSSSILIFVAVLGSYSVPAFGQDESFDPRDLSGVWVLVFSPGGPFAFGEQRPALTPEGDARYLQNIPTASNDPRLRTSDDPSESNDPTYACNPIGFPRTLHDSVIRVFEIVQLEDRVLQLLQRRRTLREFWLDEYQFYEDMERKLR